MTKQTKNPENSFSRINPPNKNRDENKKRYKHPFLSFFIILYTFSSLLPPSRKSELFNISKHYQFHNSNKKKFISRDFGLFAFLRYEKTFKDRRACSISTPKQRMLIVILFNHFPCFTFSQLKSFFFFFCFNVHLGFFIAWKTIKQ